MIQFKNELTCDFRNNELFLKICDFQNWHGVKKKITLIY